jgi:hypothetical protein
MISNRRLRFFGFIPERPLPHIDFSDMELYPLILGFHAEIDRQDAEARGSIGPSSPGAP